MLLLLLLAYSLCFFCQFEKSVTVKTPFGSLSLFGLVFCQHIVTMHGQKCVISTLKIKTNEEANAVVAHAEWHFCGNYKPQRMSQLLVVCLCLCLALCFCVHFYSSVAFTCSAVIYFRMTQKMTCYSYFVKRLQKAHTKQWRQLSPAQLLLLLCYCRMRLPIIMITFDDLWQIFAGCARCACDSQKLTNENENSKEREKEREGENFDEFH